MANAVTIKQQSIATNCEIESKSTVKVGMVIDGVEGVGKCILKQTLEVGESRLQLFYKSTIHKRFQGFCLHIPCSSRICKLLITIIYCSLSLLVYIFDSCWAYIFLNPLPILII